MAPSSVNDAMRQFMANVKGALTFVASSGTDTYTATLAPAPTAYASGMIFLVRIGTTNTSATPTLNINSLGAKTITGPSGGALVAGDLNGDHLFSYDGTNLRVMNPRIAADVLTTRGDIVVRNSSNVTARLAVGSAGTVLSSDGTDVSWSAATGGDDAIYSALAADLWNRRFNNDTETGSIQGKVDAYKADSIGTASTSETYDATNDYYANGGFSADLTTGGTAIKDSEQGGKEATKAFDDNTGTSWKTNGASPGTAYIGYQLSSAAEIRQITIQQVSGSAVTSVLVQRSSDGSSWTTVTTASILADASSQTIAVASSSTYSYWRLLSNSSTSGGLWEVSEIEMKSVGSAANMVLLDQAITLNAAATAGHVVAFVDPVDSVTLNTDLVTALTCDGGSNFANVTLTKRGSIGGGVYDIYVGKATGMTSGSTGGYRHTVANNKEMRVAGTAVRFAG